MMHIQGVSRSNLSFTKSCCENNNQQDRDILTVFKDKDKQVIMFSTPTKANQALTKDLFEKRDNFEGNSKELIKEKVKSDLATRIIAYQQMLIESLQEQIKA